MLPSPWEVTCRAYKQGPALPAPVIAPRICRSLLLLISVRRGASLATALNHNRVLAPTDFSGPALTRHTSCDFQLHPCGPSSGGCMASARYLHAGNIGQVGLFCSESNGVFKHLPMSFAIANMVNAIPLRSRVTAHSSIRISPRQLL